MTFSSDCTLNIFLFLIAKRIMFKYNMMIQCSKNKSCICRWFSLPFSVICCSFVCLFVFNRTLVFLRWVCPARVEVIKTFEGPWRQKPPNLFFLSLVFFSSFWIKVQFLYENENKCGKHDQACIAGFHMTSPKFKLKELSIVLNLYFLEVLDQLTTNIYTNIHFERVLLYAWNFETFAWRGRPKELSHRLKKWLILGDFTIGTVLVPEKLLL